MSVYGFILFHFYFILVSASINTACGLYYCLFYWCTWYMNLGLQVSQDNAFLFWLIFSNYIFIILNWFFTIQMCTFSIIVSNQIKCIGELQKLITFNGWILLKKTLPRIWFLSNLLFSELLDTSILNMLIFLTTCTSWISDLKKKANACIYL